MLVSSLFFLLFPINISFNLLDLNLIYSSFFQIIISLDYFSFVFILSLVFIFFNIMKFSKVYMENSTNYVYFIINMYMFLFSMILLLISKSWFMIMLSWEGLGITSFLLVLFYHNWNSLQGSNLTLLMNRFGDSFMLMSLFFMSNNNFFLFNLIMILTMAMTKSALFPFSNWLPAAMAAPTPVSALVHSSTLVTAGIYLMFQYNFQIFLNLMSLNWVWIFSSFTMMMGSFMAMLVKDLKKLVAYSTLSQLGFLGFTFSSMIWGLPIFHLLTHAFMKSFLFMMVGFIILSMNSQSLEKSSNMMNKFSSITMISYILLNFMSMFFSMMFFSKEILVMNSIKHNLFLFMLLYLILSLTLIYTVRIASSLMFLKNSMKLSQNKNYNFYVSKILYMLIFLFFSSMWISNILFFSDFMILSFMKIMLLYYIMFYFLVKKMKISLFYFNSISEIFGNLNIYFNKVTKDSFFMYSIFFWFMSFKMSKMLWNKILWLIFLLFLII